MPLVLVPSALQTELTLPAPTEAGQKATPRPAALFARASLAQQNLPPVPLLLISPPEAAKAMEARLEEQAVLTGLGHDALRRKMAVVQK
eukprot:506953-Prymnesium_polylepis.1